MTVSKGETRQRQKYEKKVSNESIPARVEIEPADLVLIEEHQFEIIYSEK